jgi:hypothetical protein
VSTIEELLERKSSGSGLENREYGLEIHHADHVASSICKKLALTSLISGGRLVDIVRSQTRATKFFYDFFILRLVKDFSSGAQWKLRISE